MRKAKRKYSYLFVYVICKPASNDDDDDDDERLNNNYSYTSHNNRIASLERKLPPSLTQHHNNNNSNYYYKSDHNRLRLDIASCDSLLPTFICMDIYYLSSHKAGSVRRGIRIESRHTYIHTYTHDYDTDAEL